MLSAFRKGHGCQSLLLKFIEDIKLALDNGHIVGALFMDLSKAFDCLPHGLLIAKSNAYGLTHSACALLGSYLTDRIQRVKVENTRSDWVSLSKGVPQGSILGPLLFNIFMNDMFFFMEVCDLYNYADDNSVSHSSHDIELVVSNLKKDSQNAIQWFEENGMQANPEKFQYMLLSKQDVAAASIKLSDDIEIESELSVKLLGIMIDSKLNFSEHISAICKKAGRQLNAMARISNFLDLDSRKMIFNSFIRSHFNYCPLVWHFCGKQNSDKLEKIQERALRIMYKNYESSYDELLKLSGTQTLLLQRLKIMVLEVFKSVCQLNPTCITTMFDIKEVPYSMRNPIKIIQPKRKTTHYGLRTFSYTGAKMWNELPFGLTSIDDIEITEFKRLLNTWEGPDSGSTFSFV